MRLTCIAAAPPAETRRGIIPAQTSVGSLSAALTRWIANTRTTRPVIAAPDLDLSAFRSDPIETDARLEDRHQGEWHGRNLRDLTAEHLNPWLRDSDFAPPGGESTEAMFTRIGMWMHSVHTADNPVVIARPAVIRVMLIHALGGGTEMMSSLDVPPLSRSEISAYGGWKVSAIGVEIAES